MDYSDLSWVPNAEYPHDPPLSREGMRQAHDLAKRLVHENIEVVVSSPFGRAMMTAKVFLIKTTTNNEKLKTTIN